MSSIVAYHGSCLDGSSAAAVFKYAHPDFLFFPLRSREDFEQRDEILDLLRGGKSEEVIVLDNPWFVEDYAKLAKSVVVLDHHIGAFDKMSALAQSYDNINYIFDNEKSGATLAWSYIFPDKDAPKFLLHIEDGDLYKYELGEQSKLVETYASIYLDNLEKFSEMIFERDIEEIYKIAEPALDYKNILLDYYKRNAQALHLNVAGHKIKAYNVASIRPVVSDFGHQISKIVKEPVVMFKIFGDKVNLSFRSASESFKPLPVELAQALGGNGHKLAAGASMPVKDFINALEELDNEHE